MFVRVIPAVMEEMYSQVNESDSAFELGSQGRGSIALIKLLKRCTAEKVRNWGVWDEGGGNMT